MNKVYMVRLLLPSNFFQWFFFCLDGVLTLVTILFKLKAAAEQAQNQPRERNQKGETPLHTASIRNEMDNVRKLLDAGENPNVADFAGKLHNNDLAIERLYIYRSYTNQTKCRNIYSKA